MLRTRILTRPRFGTRAASALNYFETSRLPTNTVIKFVPQQEAWLVERMGKFNRVLNPGLAILMPFVDRVAYVQSLKENAVEIPTQSAITADNVTLQIDGILYVKVYDPYKASYGVEQAEYAVSQLAQTAMRSEIGQLSLDNVLRERQQLNHNISSAINEAATDWGIRCLRYEIKDIHPPEQVLQAMHQQVSAERSKRAAILESEGKMQAEINKAEGTKQRIIREADATAQGLRTIAAAIGDKNGQDAVALQVADRYVEAFGKLAKKTNTVIVPANLGDVGGFIASGLTIFDKVKAAKKEEGSQPSTLKEISNDKTTS